MPHIGDVDDDLDKMRHLASGLFDQLADILHHFMGLLDRIMTVDTVRGIKALRALAAQIDSLSTFRYDSLTKIVAQVLFGIGLRSIEFADAGMGHRGGAFLC